jgi:uncharacterized protein
MTTQSTFGIVTERDVAVTMRDGVVLRSHVFRPDGPGEFPGILLRTPYGKPEAGYERYVRSGYAVVTQDSRGRYASDGDYVPFTEPDTGDAEDGYDAVEWLAGQPFCNGNVGTLGASYNAWMQWQLAKLRPPHLRAMCAYTIPLELTAVDWPGAFRPGRRIKWWLTTMAPDLRRRAGWPPPHTVDQARQLWDDIEGEGHWIGYLPWQDFPRHLPPGLRQYCERWLAEPERRPWRFAEIHQEVEVPNLDFSGWYDHCNDSMRHLQLMQTNGRSETARQATKLVCGPWNHPGLGKRKIDDIDFGPQAELDLTDVIIRWFDHWLKGLDNGMPTEPAVRYFVMGGGGHWRTADTWPPEETTPHRLHLLAERQLGTAEQQAATEGADCFDYDPSNPVPTLWGKAWFTGPGDRRQLEYRPDILRYRTAPLPEPVEIAGYPEVELYVESSTPDTDFFARLVDEEESGSAHEVCYGMVRLRHRHGLDRQDLVAPGQLVQLRIELGPTACCFAVGHRIRLEITSSDFPNHDRNHNTGRNDLADVELVTTTNTVRRDSARPSHIVMPVLPARPG